MSQLRVGISGWTYAPWRGVFYPRGLTHKSELEYASHRMNSIELNGTFYSLQRPKSYRKWHDATPDDFIFALKGPKYLTHMKKLQDIQQPMANFFASGPLLLGEKLGPILWQFPAWFSYHRDKLERFFQLLPKTSVAASRQAHDHDLKDESWVWTEATAETRLQYAVEVRHPSFMNADFVRLLRRYNVALVFADTAGKWPYAEDLTADLVYIRLHGAEELYSSGYTEEQLHWWADRIRRWSSGTQPADARVIDSKISRTKKKRSVYVYFDNDIKVRAPFDAIRLAEILSEGPAASPGD